LTLQTREQHIRLDKATSNVCTAQVLLANMAAMYAVFQNKAGLQAIARRVHGFAQVFANEIGKLGVAVTPGPFFDTVAFDVAPLKSTDVLKQLQDQAYNLRVLPDGRLVANFDESHNESDIHELVSVLSKAGVKGSASHTSLEVDGMLPASFARTSAFLNQKIFNSIHSETEMMRYMATLQRKDLSLDTSMISLGSCTMKLNSVSSLTPCSWPEVANMHPYAPVSQTAGYVEMLTSLEKWLQSCTGFHGCSLQPTSGASGEYAGLLVIREYLKSKGEGHRNVCIIPKSAHGTNPASAVMCGMKIKWIDDSKGVDINEFRKLCEDHKDSLAALMVTYPSTRAFFEDGIIEMTDCVHANGGQIYMDGANMNAQMNLIRPGDVGADVSHLNLHKTFCIPHGGGGPGQGPIGVKAHLAPHLPTNPFAESVEGADTYSVSGAPFGSSLITTISWAYCKMMSGHGLQTCSEFAVLNANYMLARLAPHYEIRFTNAAGRVAHEFILDMSEFKSYGIEVNDIAKRLLDFGLHPPTMSWPVPNSLMIEPTESESLEEIDRYVDALIHIRREIEDIVSGNQPRSNNILKNAPHTKEVMTADEWDRPYPRSQAAYPLPWTKEKVWPTVGRVDDVYGDKNVVTTWTDVVQQGQEQADRR